MSLRVWLPLTKDLRNQGLDGVTVTTANTNVFQNEGKLGGKSLDVSGHYAFRVPSLVKKRVFSCSFWYKPITDSSLSDNWRRIVVFDTYTSDGSTTGALFRFESSYGYQSSNTSYCISIHNNSGEPIASIGTGLGATDGWNKWQHITITADGTTLRCYRDGAQVASGAMSNGGMLQGTVHIGYSGNRPVGRLNDFRLYDHCLSQMEVKELSKGLVLHYPLNRNGWGQENLVWNSNWNLHSTTPPENWTNWGSPPTREIVTIDGKNWLHVISNTTNFQGYSQNWTKRNGVGELSAGQKVTVSFTAYLAAAATIAPIGIHWNNSSGTIVSQNWTTTALTTSPQRYAFTYTTPTDCVAFNIMVGDNTNTAHEIWITDIKLELGEIATPWCPNSSDTLATTMGLNSTTEYDCSGFCNNGTRVGTFEWTSDTPKYCVSTKFGGSNYIKTLPGEFSWSNYDNLTIAAWMKPAATPGRTGSIGIASDASSYTNKAVAISNYGGKFSIHIPNGSAWGTTQSTYTIPLNTWHHCVATISGTTVKMYVDGVLNKTFTADFGTATNHANPQIEVGVDLPGSDEIYNGYYSDVRIYATALSASDVKSLYQNSAYIDSSGNVYGAVHEEV